MIGYHWINGGLWGGKWTNWINVKGFPPKHVFYIYMLQEKNINLIKIDLNMDFWKIKSKSNHLKVHDYLLIKIFIRFFWIHLKIYISILSPYEISSIKMMMKNAFKYECKCVCIIWLLCVFFSSWQSYSKIDIMMIWVHVYGIWIDDTL